MTTVDIKIAIESDIGTPQEAPRRCTRPWDVDTAIFLIDEHGAAWGRARECDLVVISLLFSQPINHQTALSVRSAKWKPWTVDAMIRILPHLDPQLWTQVLLRDNVALTLSAPPPADIESALRQIAEDSAAGDP